MSTKRVTALAASLVWSVESTRCPVSDAWTAICAVSRSRISPTSTTLGSCRRIPTSCWWARSATARQSEEHTSELQSHLNLVCRLLLEKKKKASKAIQHRVTYNVGAVKEKGEVRLRV